MRPCKAFAFQPSTLDRHTSMSTPSSISPLGFWSPVARHRSLPSRLRVAGRRLRAAGRPSPHARFSMPAPTSWLSTLELSTFDSQLLTVRRLFFSLSPLEYPLTQKRASNSFGIRTYKSLDLKSPGMNSYKKYRGGGGHRPCLSCPFGFLTPSANACIRLRLPYRRQSRLLRFLSLL